MRNNDQIVQDIKNLDLLIANAQCSVSMFRFERDNLIKNWFFASNHSKHLKDYLQNLITECSDDQAKFNNPLYVNLYTTLTYFLNLEPNQVLKDINLKTKNLGRHSLTLERLGHKNSANHFKTKIKKLPTIQYQPQVGHYTSPDDDHAHHHGEQASSIFFSTQFERFKAFLNWVFEKMGIHIYEAARYQEHNYLDSDIYSHEPALKPNSQNIQYYWVGHATNYVVFPNKGKPLHILTDPLEGGLAPLIYPRMTDEGKLIEGEDERRLPKVDVVIISHNHHDHLCEMTLKRLVKQQPKMIIPQGDRELFENLGFTDIVELEWWEQASIKHAGEPEYLRITAVPARHWSGRGLHDAHRSAFNGYVLQTPNQNEGDLYFAGDTALMDNSLTNPIFEHFNITTSLQPGGPDQSRDDMAPTHQSSADGIEMHFKMLLSHYKKMQADDENLRFADFIEQTKSIKTIYNHTSTFKLGNLRLKDTNFSFQRLNIAFKETENWRKVHLAPHEMKAYDRIMELAQTMVFEDGQSLTPDQIIKLMVNSVIIPKIGQRIDLDAVEGANSYQNSSYRNLISNRRALVEYDDLFITFLMNNREFKLGNVKQFIIQLLDNYQDPWYGLFSRTFSPHNLRKRYHNLINDCENYDDLMQTLNLMEKDMGLRKNNEHQNSDPFNPHGHMQSLIHYGKWIASLADVGASNNYFIEFFACLQIRQLVDQEIHNSGWFFEDDRTPKQKAFRTLGDSLAKSNPGEYDQILKKWTSANYNLLTRPRTSDGDRTQSSKVVRKISGLVNNFIFSKPQQKDVREQVNFVRKII